MNIVSWQFAIFVMITAGVYYCLNTRAQNIWLLLTSYFFYFILNPWFALILFALTLFSFLVSKRLIVHSSKRRYWLLLGLSCLGGLLLTFKLGASDYRAYFFNLLQLKANATLPYQVLLPIGFAFYSLQAISYLVDIYKGLLVPVPSFIDFALYLSFFPKLLSGPIERAKSFLTKLTSPRLVTNELLGESLALIIVGLVRKLAIADVLPQIVSLDSVWTGVAYPYKTPELVLWLVVYAFTLYNDFAGYTSIIRGVSCLFGFSLSPNFRQPFFARSFTEFWNRWHISLSHWLRDYIFFPLSRLMLKWSKGQRNFFNVTLPILVTMLLSGLWHSIGFYMLLWGGLHGVYQVVERLPVIERLFLRIEEQKLWRQFLNALLVFVFTCIAWVPFALATLQGNAGAFSFWKAIFVAPKWGFSDPWFLMALIPIVLSFYIDAIQTITGGEAGFTKLHVVWRGVLLTLAVLLIYLFGALQNTKGFIYQGF